MTMSPVPLAHRGPQLLRLLSNVSLSRENRMPYRYNSKRTAGAATTILLLFQWHRKHLSFSDNNTSTTENLVEIEIAQECGFLRFVVCVGIDIGERKVEPMSDPRIRVGRAGSLGASGWCLGTSRRHSTQRCFAVAATFGNEH